MASNSKIKDVGKPDSAGFLDKVSEAVSRLLGARGDKDSSGEWLDRAITPRDLMNDAFRASFNVGNGTGTGTSAVVIQPGAGSGDTSSEPDLTPPPTPTGLKATAGLANIMVEWDAALYPQGHGHGQTNVYVVKYLSTDPTQPTFADAKLYAMAPNALTMIAMPADIGVRWHIWIKWQSADGVESVAPAGGTNGVIAQPGKIGRDDLAPLLIEASALEQQDFSNLVGNPDGRYGATGWYTAGSVQPIAGNSPGTIPFWGGPYLYFSDRDNVYGNGFAVQAGQQYRTQAQMTPQGNEASPYSCGIGLYLFDTLAHCNSNTPSAIVFGAVMPGTAVGMRSLSGFVTIPAGQLYAKPFIWIDGPWGGVAPNGFFAGAIDVRRRTDDTMIVNGAIQAFHLAANSIAVGTAAIQAGAIVNFMLGNGSIDDVKIANMSAAKISIGDGTVGGVLKSANFSTVGPNNNGWYLRPSDGYFEANNALLRGGIYASYGTIGGANINANGVFSWNWTGPGGAGWYIENATGTIYANNLYARGDIQATSLEANTGHIGGANINAEGIYSSNWTGVGGVGWWLHNSDGTIYANNVYARGDIQATSIRADVANIVNTLQLQGGSVGVFRFQKGPDGNGGGLNGIFVDVPVTPTDLSTGVVKIFVQGTISFSSTNRFSLGYTYTPGVGAPGEVGTMPSSPGDGNLFNGQPPGGVWPVAQSIEAYGAGIYRIAIWVTAGAIGASNPGVLSISLAAQFGRRNA